MTHAGFWVDGAARQPDEKHRDKIGCVLVRWKNDSQNDSQYDFDVMLSGFRDWRQVYWLDTTPRELLTPEELFSVVKLLFPGIDHVAEDSWAIDYLGDSIKIDWNGETQYPPQAIPQLVRVTRENVGQYMFRKCRCGDGQSGIVAGWHVQDDCCLVSCVVNDGEESIIQFRCVQVLDESR